MGLFANLPTNSTQNPAQNKTLFGGKNNGEIEDESTAIRGGSGDGNAAASGGGGGNADNGNSGRTASEGNDSGSGGRSDGSSGTGLFALSIADSDIDGAIGSGGTTGDGDDQRSPEPQGSDAEDTQESIRDRQSVSRPSFLNFKADGDKKKTEQAKDVKIQKRRGPKGKDGQYLNNAQMEIAFVGAFDAVALFRGPHWKLEDEEIKNVVPSLTRIFNRVLDALPAGVGKHAFNIADYIILLAAVGAIVYKRTSYEKRLAQGGQKGVTEVDRKQSSNVQSVNVPAGSEGSHGADRGNSVNPSEQNNGVSSGVSSLAPIKDLASSITRIS